MNDISRQELHDIALVAGLEINDEECALFAEEIRSVLTYIEELNQVDITPCELNNDQQKPLMREDQACVNDEAYQQQAKSLIQNAPVHEDSYFVVPQMIRKTRS